MADLLDTYDADFQLAIQEAKAQFLAVGRDPTQRLQALKSIEHATDEALEILDQMNVEVQNLPAWPKTQRLDSTVQRWPAQSRSCVSS